MAVKRNHLTENEGSQLMLQKDKEMVVKKKETQQGGGWGLGMETGRLSLENGTGMQWRCTSRLKKAGTSGGD